MTAKNDITGDSLVSKSSTNSYRDNFDRTFGKAPVPQTYHDTAYCSCIECLRAAIDDDEPTCPSCGGPVYTQPHWQYWQCDDCGRREDKEPEEP